MVGNCQWTRDGFALGAGRSMTGYPRYIMSGTREDICDLVIEPVLPLDEGSYQCQVSGSINVAPIITNRVEIQVNSPPNKPRIVNENEHKLVNRELGDEVELKCESEGGRPAAELQWWDDKTGKKILANVIFPRWTLG